MSWSFRIGRLFGTEIRVHATFLLLVAWIAASGWAMGGPQGALVNTVFVLLLFACVVAHEFGHVLTARRFGIRTPDVTLWPIGGIASLERMPSDPRQEILVALAGPAVNLMIWAALTLAFGASSAQDLAAESWSLAALPRHLATVNLVLALFNLIPAFPMDGGRVLRAALALFMPRLQATRVAAAVGQALAIGLGFWGLATGNVVLALIGVFVFWAAQAESADTQMRSLARRYRAADAMVTRFQALRADDDVSRAVETLLHTTQHEFPVLGPGGAFEGFLTREALFHALASDQAPRRVEALMVRDIPAVPPGAPLDRVLALLGPQVPAVAVTGPGGALLGYITRENLGELMVVAGAQPGRSAAA